MMRLDKYLAERTGMTRSESRKAVTKGRVMVGGMVCRKADTQLDEHTAEVALDGTPLAGASEAERQPPGNTKFFILGSFSSMRSISCSIFSMLS